MDQSVKIAAIVGVVVLILGAGAMFLFRGNQPAANPAAAQSMDALQQQQIQIEQQGGPVQSGAQPMTPEQQQLQIEQGMPAQPRPGM
jgi:hypothetical protein